MVRAYHVIFTAYGFWLPNDPRGSWSDYVRSWEIFRHGPATKTDLRRSHARDEHDHRKRRAAKQSLRHPPVTFTGRQGLSVAEGFRNAIARSGYRFGACAILPDHVHAVIARGAHEIEKIVGQLKGEATKQLRRSCPPSVRTSRRPALTVGAPGMERVPGQRRGDPSRYPLR